MAVVTMRQLLDSGVHFGHQTRRWNPKMKRFILTERSGSYIIDLQQSLALHRQDVRLRQARRSPTAAPSSSSAPRSRPRSAIAEQATRVGQPYVNQRWLGGLLTNFQTVSKRLARMKELEELDFEDTTQRLHQEGAAHQEARARQAAQVARRHPQPHARPRARSGSSTPRRSTSRSTRPRSWASRSSASSTRTATPTRSSTRSRATTTPSAPSAC